MKTKIDKYIVLGKNGIINNIIGPNLSRSLFNKFSHTVGPLTSIKTFSSARLCFEPKNKKHEAREFKKWISTWYAKRKGYGPFGDMMRLSRISFCLSKASNHSGEVVIYTLDLFGQITFHLPGLATDLVLFLRDAKGKKYVVGITRKQAPAKGKFALVGGYRNITGYHFESALETILREAKEEIGIDMKLSRSSKKNLLAQPYPEQAFVKVKFVKEGYRASGTLRYIGSFFSSNEENMPSLRQKRAHEAAAYGLVLELPVINKKLCRELFKASDDASKIVILQVDEAKFPLSNHEATFRAARNLFWL